MAAVLRLFHLGTQSLWVDEAFTWTSAGLGTPIHWSDLVDNVHGPLYSLLLHAFCGLAGDSEWALRLPSALFGVATVPAMAWLAAEWLGPAAAVPAAWLAATSPFLVWYSQEARNYALLILCVCVATAALLALARRGGAGRAGGYLAATWAGLLSNLSFAFLLPLHARLWLTGPGPRARRWRGLAAFALALALALLPWGLAATRIWDFHRLNPGASAAGETPLRGATTFHAAALPFAAHSFAVGYSLGPSLRELRAHASLDTLRRHAPELALVALLFGTLLGLGLRAVARRGRLVDALLWIGIPALAVSWFALRNFKVFHPRYLAVAAPAFVLLLAAAFTELKGARRVALALALALTWGASLAQLYGNPTYAKEDMRGAAALVRAQGRPGERVLVLGADEPFFYYYRGPLPATRLWLGLVQRPARLREEWDRARAGASGVWVVLSRPEDLDPRDEFARFIATDHPQAFTRDGVRIWHWVAAAS